MGCHPRIEIPGTASFLTTRSRNSELWFVNNEKLEEAILGYVAKYATRYSVVLYGIALEGNHKQGVAKFPLMNRSDFMRDLNSSVARAVPRYVLDFPGGSFWGRRYSSEIVPGAEDIEEYFFYTALQPIKDGLVERLSDYPGYNFFHDAIWGIEREYQVVNWKEYNRARKRKGFVPISDYIETYALKYERIPGYEQLTQKEYAEMMLKKFELRREAIVRERRAKGLGFLGREKLLKVRPGSRPKNTKTSDINSHRPRVLSVCPERRAETKAHYFSIYFSYKDASKRYRNGELSVVFPFGTHKPYIPHRLNSG